VRIPEWLTVSQVRALEDKPAIQAFCSAYKPNVGTLQVWQNKKLLKLGKGYTLNGNTITLKNRGTFRVDYPF
jgi:hypothetical protein